MVKEGSKKYNWKYLSKKPCIGAWMLYYVCKISYAIKYSAFWNGLNGENMPLLPIKVILKDVDIQTLACHVCFLLIFVTLKYKE